MRKALLALAGMGAAALVAWLLLGHGATPGPEDGRETVRTESPRAGAVLVGAARAHPPGPGTGDYRGADLPRTLGALRFQPPNVPAAAVARLRVLCAAEPGLIEHLVRVALGLEAFAYGALPEDYPYGAQAAAYWAVQALPREATPVVAGLFEHYRDDRRRRRALLNLLASFGADAEKAVPTLLETLSLDDLPTDLGRYVLFTLASIGRAAGAATPKLLAWARDPAHPLHGDAVQHLYAVAGPSPEAKALYAGILEGAEHEDRERAFQVVLFQMEQDAEGLRPIFVRLLEDPHPDIRMWAAMALGQIGVRSEAVVERLGRMAEEESSDTETAALGALRSAGERGQQELLTVARRAEYYETAVNALYHLGHTGYPVRDHPDLLLSLLRDAETGVRGRIASLLAQIDPGPRAADFLPFLRGQLGDPESPLRGEALAIAANLEGDAAGTGLDLLLEAVADDALRPWAIEHLLTRPADVTRIVAALEPYVAEAKVMDALCALAYQHPAAEALLRRLASSADEGLPRIRAREALQDLEDVRARQRTRASPR